MRIDDLNPADFPKEKHETSSHESPSRELSPKDLRLLSRAVGSMFGAQRRGGRELVAGGDIKWKPIDAQAAKLLSKAPEMGKVRKAGVVPHNKNENTEFAWRCELAAKLIRMTEKAIGNSTELAVQVEEARKAIMQATDSFRADALEFMKELPDILKQVRDWRMTVTREKGMAIEAMADIRKFFLNKDHEEEMARLRDFVSLSERLKKIADDGTLDRVADVMLKLAE